MILYSPLFLNPRSRVDISTDLRPASIYVRTGQLDVLLCLDLDDAVNDAKSTKSRASTQGTPSREQGCTVPRELIDFLNEPASSEPKSAIILLAGNPDLTLATLPPID